MSGLQFQQLISPVPLVTFRSEILGKSPAHIPGPRDKFAQVFSWAELNRLLGMSKLWSDQTMKLVLDGRDVPHTEYCTAGVNRDGTRVLLPVSKSLHGFLERGATMILDLVETLSPGIHTVTNALAMETGATIVCNLYCSWQAHQGFSSHFDTTDVFALQIDGSKTWRVYEGRMDNPIGLPDAPFTNMSPQDHNRAKGKVMREIDMAPGDLLYLPRGQYHDALASSEASLHLSFGITHATGIDFMGILNRSLADDPLFRQELPHFDFAAAHEQHLAALANRLKILLTDPELSQQIRDYQKQRAFRDGLAPYQLPDRGVSALYRVKIGANVRHDAAATLVLERGDTVLEFAGEEVAYVEWIMNQALFSGAEFSSVHELDASAVDVLFSKLIAADFIEGL